MTPSPLTVTRNNYIKNPKRCDISTPPVVAEFIAGLFPAVSTVFDPCIGNGALVAPFEKRSCQIIWQEAKRGLDFLAASELVECDLVVCNPPFNLGVGRKLGSEVFLRKILEVCGFSVPIVLFVPMGFRLNQRKRSQRWQWLAESAPPITSILSLPLDIFQGVEFHNEVLFFNAPRLEPHYFLALDHNKMPRPR